MIDHRRLLLAHALPLVPFDGWGESTLRTAAKAAGLDDIALRRAFPAGSLDCVRYFFTEADAALGEDCPQASLAALRMPERIETLVLARFAHWRPHREAARRAVAMLALPWNAAHGLKALYHTVNTMWRLAGDTATDFSHYTKRATLAGVYSATLLCWLDDASPDEEDTKRFLRHRLEHIAAFGKWKKRMQEKKKRFGV